MRTTRALLVLALGSASAAAAQTAPSNRLDGVWMRVAATIGENVITNQAGYRIIVDGHYSQVWVNGLAPRPPLPATGATAAQIMSSLNLNAQGGTLEVTSMQTMTQRPTVALNPANMAAGQYGILQYRVAGDTMWASQIMTQNGPVANGQIAKYVRVRAGGPSPLDGAWRMVEIREANGTVSRTQPGIRVFKDGYFGLVRVNGTSPRPATIPPNATPEEAMAVLGPFAAQAGTFEVSGQTVTERSLVAKNPAGMAPGNFARINWRIRGDSLWMTLVESQTGPATDQATRLYLRLKPGPRPPTN
jgi:hypothetical protein